MELNRPQGSFVALITPMNTDGSIDFEGFRTLLQFHEENGTSAVLIMGSTGEVSMLSVEERHAIVRNAEAADAVVVAGEAAHLLAHQRVPHVAVEVVIAREDIAAGQGRVNRGDAGTAGGRRRFRLLAPERCAYCNA